MKSRRRMAGLRPHGRDSADNFGPRHYNKYASRPAVVRDRTWCDASNNGGDYCQLASGHAGKHVYGKGKR